MHTRGCRPQRRGEHGAALLLVVLIISLLAMLVIEFQRRAGLELQAARNLRESVQSHSLSLSGLTVAQVLLMEDQAQSKYDGRDEFWNTPKEGLPVPIDDPTGQVTVTVKLVEDLDGKFPLGALVDDAGNEVSKVKAAYGRFLDALNQHLKEAPEDPTDILDQVNRADLAEALVDWMDANDQGGFESNADFTVPNTRITHLDNLQRVGGYGLVPEGYTHSIADVILPYVDTRKDDEVNMNTAQVPVLMATHPDISYADALDLFADLYENPDTTSFDPKAHSSVSGITPGKFELGRKVTSDRFFVRLLVDVGGVAHYSEAILVRGSPGSMPLPEQWREGWMVPQWRPAWVYPELGGLLGLPAGSGGGTGSGGSGGTGGTGGGN